METLHSRGVVGEGFARSGVVVWIRGDVGQDFASWYTRTCTVCVLIDGVECGQFAYVYSKCIVDLYACLD